MAKKQHWVCMHGNAALWDTACTVHFFANIFVLSQTFLSSIKLIENRSNIYDVKLVYYETTFQNRLSDNVISN
jgi:hypothetical protein